MVEPSANRKISCNSSKEFNRKKWCYLFAVIYDILFVKLNEEHFYILRHQMMHYPTVKDNVDLEFLSTPHCKIRNSSYEFAVLSKNKILRDFWEILRDSKFQNSKVILVRFRAFMTETLERYRSNQNRNTNSNEQKIWGFES